MSSILQELADEARKRVAADRQRVSLDEMKDIAGYAQTLP